MQATATAHPNIALVKYWGKRDVDRNLPAVGSLSITLDGLRTRTCVRFDRHLGADRLTVNGETAPEMLGRVSRALDRLAANDRPPAEVTSDVNFPIGAGLASSASAFAALVLAASHALGLDRSTLELARLAGGASGSAARSMFGGFVELQADGEDIAVQQLCMPSDWPLQVVVGITDESPKAVSSGDAMMRSASTSPFYASWVARQPDDIRVARAAVAGRDFDALAAVAEHNCLKMHSLMWTSRPPVVYWNSATLQCLETVRALQARGEQVFFTMDAGPQVKAVCTAASADAVEEALAAIDGIVATRRIGLGQGARLLPA